MRIAVVGSGIAGLTAAYLLNRAHDVTLFEREDHAGGHANTIAVDAGAGREVALDTGFLVYNEHTYPGFTRLLAQLNVPTKVGDMSLGVQCQACGLDYSSRGIGGMLAQRRNALRPGRAMLAVDMLRFFRDTRRALATASYGDATLGEFARARRYGGEFVRHFLLPLASAVWSTPTRDVGSFPARYFLGFLHNHGIIGLQPAYVWRTVAGGSREYVRRMTETLPCGVRLSATVRRVLRGCDGVRLMLESGERVDVDAIVLACHADEALRLLGDASTEEERALGGFSYTRNEAVLHTDASMLPRLPRARASWNYATADCRAPGGSLGMTYHLNRLQALDEPVDYCVSLNARGIDPATIIRTMTYDHPQYTFGTLTAQQRVQALQGERRTWFAGAHLGYGFHEDGYASGARVADAFGIAP